MRSAEQKKYLMNEVLGAPAGGTVGGHDETPQRDIALNHEVEVEAESKERHPTNIELWKDNWPGDENDICADCSRPLTRTLISMTEGDRPVWPVHVCTLCGDTINQG